MFSFIVINQAAQYKAQKYPAHPRIPKCECRRMRCSWTFYEAVCDSRYWQFLTKYV